MEVQAAPVLMLRGGFFYPRLGLDRDPQRQALRGTERCVRERTMDSAAQVFFADGLRFECQGSGRCCTSRGEYGYVYLSSADVVRLAAILELSAPEFKRAHCERSDGLWHLKHPDRNCQFLDGTRCGVYDGRPEQCRTWPFWPETMVDARTWQREVAAFCPGVGKGPLHSKQYILKILEEQA